MSDSFQKLARILRTSPEVLLDLDKKMSDLTGKSGIMEAIAKENDILVDRTLTELNLSRDSRAEDVYSALTHRLIHLDEHLNTLLDKPDLIKMAMSNSCGKLCEIIFQIFKPPKGLFIKKEKVVELLEKFKPDNLLKHFGYTDVKELVEKEGFASVISALRFTQSTEWMHNFFDAAYSELVPDDFEEREVEIKILEEKWLKVADQFLEKKYHNVSHLKEYGVIFIIPLTIDTPGETTRLLTLLLHYLHEVPFYSDLFRKFLNDKDFNEKFRSLLRGDVLEVQMMADKIKENKNIWFIIQRYLAKDNVSDPRLFLPHLNPEAEHWVKVSNDLTALSKLSSEDDGHISLGYWSGLDFVGDFFPSASSGQVQLVSFDLIDLIMSLVKKGEIKYLYHQQEALWNKIFTEYMGKEKMEKLLEENIIQGSFEL
ncbi:MAG: hypothetical protein A2606_01460 [Candidatus Yanofskybacteria bacterium RIFOXYD1_FULL_42_10]|uniref:Glycosidase related protein n=1 Tax=Candidatus Yanofskybacteria bacterium RIFOXYD1_FULL_42_10 TaxID=1802718 RepID=A0A1F8HVF4_9BACT|nr:MAG: hypothetical protein A2606_01460 [Candidatus Yanofskybacteria bacterium RIFOXYD1_FULL_42_10]